MAKYIVHAGTFPCHTCGFEVKTVRQYPKEKRLTWMCPERHVSDVSLETKKVRADYERER
jgi:hypothetical protein